MFNPPIDNCTFKDTSSANFNIQKRKTQINQDKSFDSSTEPLPKKLFEQICENPTDLQSSVTVDSNISNPEETFDCFPNFVPRVKREQNCPISKHLDEVEKESATQNDLQLCCSTMDSNLRRVLKKFVRSDYVLNCLELAGFDSPAVIMCLNETNLRQLEEFVGSTCSLMTSINNRQRYLGPVFAHHPDNFRLPTGVLCGLRLAVEELKQTKQEPQQLSTHSLNGKSQSASSSHMKTPPSTPGMFSDEHGPESAVHFDLSDAMTQTDVSFPVSLELGYSTISTPCTNSIKFTHPQQLIRNTDKSEEINLTCHPPVSHVTSSPSAITNHISTFPIDVDSPTEDMTAVISVSDMVNSSFKTLPKSDSNLLVNIENSLTSTSQHSHNMLSPNSNFTDREIERLIQHSSASACRLAARQFVNANLIRGLNFDMDMEVSACEGGQRRVTGIFYCHLCRETRERTCPVRFSVARNRYPVMSNVLSHLKTHFQYRTVGGHQLLPSRKSTANETFPSDNLLEPFQDSNLSTHSPSSSFSPPSSQPNFLASNSLCNLVSQVVHLASTVTPSVAFPATSNDFVSRDCIVGSRDIHYATFSSHQSSPSKLSNSHSTQIRRNEFT